MSKTTNMGLARAAKVAVVKNSLQEVFAARLKRAGRTAKTVVIASPWITSDTAAGGGAVKVVCDVVQRYGIPTYVFTKTPHGAHQQRALDVLAGCPTVEIVLNESLHAKIYACLAPYPFGFALLGSANMTKGSSYLHEVGLIVSAGGSGQEVVRELAAFGLDYLRTRPESVVVKRIIRGGY